jgi:hypothetical protein
MADQRTPRIYTAADVDKWLAADSSKSLKGLMLRDAKLLDAWTALRAERPEMTVMHVCDGLAYDGGDARSLTISVSVSKLSGRETK